MLEVHVNFGGLEEAERIARAAVERRLAACANIHPGIRSIYWWNAAVQAEDEIHVVFKTAAAKVDALMAFVGEAHSYDTPGIIVHRPEAANRAYLDWIERESGQDQS